jgi:hypothetical protein
MANLSCWGFSASDDTVATILGSGAEAGPHSLFDFKTIVFDYNKQANDEMLNLDVSQTTLHIPYDGFDQKGRQWEKNWST